MFADVSELAGSLIAGIFSVSRFDISDLKREEMTLKFRRCERNQLLRREKDWSKKNFAQRIGKIRMSKNLAVSDGLCREKTFCSGLVIVPIAALSYIRA